MFEIRLKEVLKKKNMSIARLHELTGISQNTLGLIANGKNKGIQFETLDKIIDVLDIELKDILIHYSNHNNIFALPVKNNYSILKENEKRKLRYQFFNYTEEGEKEFLFDLSFHFHFFYSDKELLIKSKKLHLFVSYYSQNHSELPINTKLVNKINHLYEDRSGLNILAYLIVHDILKNFQNILDFENSISSATVDFFGFERDNPYFLEVQVPIKSNIKIQRPLSKSKSYPEKYFPDYSYLLSNFSNIKDVDYLDEIPIIKVIY